MKLFKTLRNHWKKSIFFSAVGIYGVNYFLDWRRDVGIRETYCKQAQRYGQQPLFSKYRPRKVTVFLNPAAKDGKARKLFESNIAPLLHLAGLEVTVIRTEYEGQAKKYMEVIEATDAIIVAGGDGTLCEVLTGLLRRPEEDGVSKIPIGVLPLGRTNTLASSLAYKGDSEIRWMGELALSIIRETTRPIDVMQIKADDKYVYAVGCLEWSAFRDAQCRKGKYWFFGPLKHRLTYMLASLSKDWPFTREAELTYTGLCDGCNRCYEPPTTGQQRWWQIFSRPKVTDLPGKQTKQSTDDFNMLRFHTAQNIHKNTVNKDCGLERCENMKSPELLLETSNTSKRPEQNFHGLRVTISPSEYSRKGFIEEGWKREKGKRSSKGTKTFFASSVKLNLPLFEEETEDWFTIDSERFEAKPVEVKLLKQKVKVFAPETFYH